jgi:hypothetical protein
VTVATPADEDQQKKRALLARLRALQADCLAMVDEARASIALLDSTKLPNGSAPVAGFGQAGAVPRPRTKS